MESQTFTPADDVSAIVNMFGRDLEDPMRPLTVLIRFCVREGTQEMVECLFAAARVSTLRESGCLAFEINRQANDPSRFVVYEKWKALTALDVHLRKSYTVQLRDAFNGLIVGTPEFNVLVPTEGTH